LPWSAVISYRSINNRIR